MSHYEHPLYATNSGLFSRQDPIPLPPADGFPVEINGYDDVAEPRFDPAVHLALGRPDYIRLLPDFEKSSKLPAPAVDSGRGSAFAYSAPFQVLSEEGVRVVREIADRYEHHAYGPANSRGKKNFLRGLYYRSPFIRDFQNCQELKDLFREVAGEDVIPHCCLSVAPQINWSIVEKDRKSIPLDPWHWDSVAYTGVLLLNDMDGLDGGELELMNMDKRKGLEKLSDGSFQSALHSDVISYEKPGKMIFAQGSEVLHHVTPVLSEHRRISMVMAYAPANAFQPPKSILQTMIRSDATNKLAEYEYFREKAWQCSHALKGHTEAVKYSKDGKDLGKYLRSVAQELDRACDVLEGKTCDVIDFFDEVNKKVAADFKK